MWMGMVRIVKAHGLMRILRAVLDRINGPLVGWGLVQGREQDKGLNVDPRARTINGKGRMAGEISFLPRGSLSMSLRKAHSLPYPKQMQVSKEMLRSEGESFILKFSKLFFSIFSMRLNNY
jgi:hypothetical protein